MTVRKSTAAPFRQKKTLILSESTTQLFYFLITEKCCTGTSTVFIKHLDRKKVRRKHFPPSLFYRADCGDCFLFEKQTIKTRSSVKRHHFPFWSYLGVKRNVVIQDHLLRVASPECDVDIGVRRKAGQDKSVRLNHGEKIEAGILQQMFTVINIKVDLKLNRQ